MNNPGALHKLTTDLATATWTLCALGALCESGLVDHLAEPRSTAELAQRCRSLSLGQIERCLAVLHAEGIIVSDGERHRLAQGLSPFLRAPLRGSLAGEIRTNLMQALALLDTARHAVEPNLGWRHADPVLLQAQGDASSGLAAFMRDAIVPDLDGLSTRLAQPDARLLDVGVGVGALAIALCRAFPALSVVGLDVYERALTLARDNVERHDLGGRIELRHVGLEALDDRDAFDCAWVPSFFIPTAREASGGLLRALRPGGWVLFAVSGAGQDDRQRAVWSLVDELWGGASLDAPSAERVLRDGGFTRVRTLPGPDWALALVVGRKAA